VLVVVVVLTEQGTLALTEQLRVPAMAQCVQLSATTLVTKVLAYQKYCSVQKHEM